MNGAHARHVVGVDEVVLEDGELLRVGDRVVGAVLLAEEVVTWAVVNSCV